VTDIQSLLAVPTDAQIEHGIVVVTPDRANEFDEHWASAEHAIPAGKREAARRFLAPILQDDRVHGVVLDAGCGDGVHAVLLEEEAPGGTLRVGLDISGRALHSTRARVGDRWQLVQAGLEDLPFRDETFDLVYAYGVVAYTDDPSRSVSELARVTRRGGLVGIWVSPRHGGPAGAALAVVRAICSVVGRRGTLAIANALVPFLGLLPTASRVTLRTAGWRGCREVVLVNIAPRRLVFPSRDEVAGWVTHAGLDVIDEPRDTPVTIWAQRP